MTVYAKTLQQRFASELAKMQRQIKKLQSRTAAIDSGVVIPNDPWQDVATGVGFAVAQWADGGSPYPLASFHLIPGNRVAVRCRLLWTDTGSGMPSGQAMWTVPAKYCPASQHSMFAVLYGSNGALVANRVPSVEVTTAGELILYGVTVPATSGDTATISVNDSYPLD